MWSVKFSDITNLLTPLHVSFTNSWRRTPGNATAIPSKPNRCWINYFTRYCRLSDSLSQRSAQSHAVITWESTMVTAVLLRIWCLCQAAPFLVQWRLLNATCTLGSPPIEAVSTLVLVQLTTCNRTRHECLFFIFYLFINQPIAHT